MSNGKDLVYEPLSSGGSYPTAPPPGYEQNQQPVTQAPTPVTGAANVFMTTQSFSAGPVGPKSTDTYCPQCRCRIKTKVRHRSTAKTHIACILLSWTFCCCCLPYCMDSCRNANHFCPMCGTFIGTYAS